MPSIRTLYPEPPPPSAPTQRWPIVVGIVIASVALGTILGGLF